MTPGSSPGTPGMAPGRAPGMTQGTTSRTPDTLVVGGGLAGIAAALKLRASGADVVLAEARPRLGGATYSFDRAGLAIDTGQHVFLRCYSAYRWLLGELGVAGLTEVQDGFAVSVRDPYGGRHRLARTRGLRAPLHLAPTVLGYRPLSTSERVRALRAAAALRRVDPDDPRVQTQSFGAWLRAHGQSPAAVRRLWAPISTAALNVEPDGAALALAARVFRTGLLDSAAAGDIGIPRVPLDDLHGGPARRELERRGVQVRPRTRVESLTGDREGFEARGADGTRIRARTVVLAVPHPAAARLVPAEAAPDRAGWERLGAAPIVDLHLRYDRVVCEEIRREGGFFAAIDSPIQWVFDRTRAAGLGQGQEQGQYLACSLSAADALIGLPTRTIAERLLPAVADLIPATRTARLVDCFVTREAQATFRQGPGCARWRPPATTRLAGLVLAGAWVATGWPDTMEGAVRSGTHAADLLARRTTAPVTEEVV